MALAQLTQMLADHFQIIYRRNEVIRRLYIEVGMEVMNMQHDAVALVIETIDPNDCIMY